MEFFQANIKFHEVLVQLLAFIIVFLALKKLAWKSILDGLEARRARIQGDFDKIDAAKKEIESLRTEYETHMKKLDEESRAKLQDAVAEGQRIARDIQEKARTESQQAFEKSKENLTLEVAKARIELRQEIAQLTVSATEKILKEKLTDAKQQEKILTVIDALESDLSSKKGNA